MENDEVFKELVLLKENSFKGLFNLGIIAASNQDSGSLLHSFAAKIRIDCLLCLCQSASLSMIYAFTF